MNIAAEPVSQNQMIVQEGTSLANSGGTTATASTATAMPETSGAPARQTVGSMA